ncbi:UDP-3-O-acyl-N-acetylglucosamine deacetylase [Coralliovum pocilloporae]|uniref:UDP-3-O-acyl-N-acetylglucosamine deacetylase n=1 Tax=Coralliovum pocilloporae TaxID=3066369 RepID=UPI00330750F1
MTMTDVRRQHTLAEPVELSGIGVHSGKPVSMTLHPAEDDHGIVFLRSEDGKDYEIRASHKVVSATELCTVLGDPSSVSVATVEHLMAALVAYGVDNVLIEIDGPEVPVFDGSSAAYIDAFEQVGLKQQRRARRFIKVLKPVRIENGQSYAELRPFDGSRFEVEIDFDTPVIGRQKFSGDLSPAVFRDELSRARTFGFMKDVEGLWAMGYALGSSLDNTVVLGDDEVVNPEGLRYPDEFVRHKTLDAVGDLSLAGAPILGLYRSYRGGHRVNINMVKALFADPDAWEYVEEAPTRTVGHGELPAGIAAAAFRADVS